MTQVLARARVGSLSPERYSFTLRKENAPWLDLTDVSAVTLQVQKPSGSTQTWTAVIESQEEDELTGYYPYVAGNLDESGDYRVTPKATVAADISTGPVQWNPVTLRVWGLYE